MRQKIYLSLGTVFLLLVGFLIIPSLASTVHAEIIPTSLLTSDQGMGLIREYPFGEGATEPKIKHAFEYLMYGTNFPQVPRMHPISATYTFSLSPYRNVVAQDMLENTSTRKFLALYNKDLGATFPVETRLLDEVQGRAGLPTSLPREQLTKDNNAEHIQSFETGYLTFVTRDSYTSELSSKEFTTYKELKNKTAFTPGEGIVDTEIKNAFLAKYHFNRTSLGSPIALAVVSQKNIISQLFSTPKGNSLLVYNPEEKIVYPIAPSISKKITLNDLDDIGYPLDDAYETSQSVSQTFDHVAIHYDSQKDQITTTSRFAKQSAESSEIGETHMPHMGETASMFIRVRFPDLDYTNTPDASYYEKVLNGDTGYTLRNYWKTVSGGRFSTKVIIQDVMMPMSLKDALIQYPNESGGTNTDLAKAAMDVIAQTPLAWELGDINGKDGVPDGYIDHIFLAYDIHTPQLEKANIHNYSFRAFAWPAKYLTDTTKVRSKITQKEFTMGPVAVVSLAANGLGVLAHEMGHDLGLIDMYDYDSSSAGLGKYSLMAYSHLTFQNIISDFYKQASVPQMLDAYSRKKLGWANVVEIKGHQDITLFPSTESDTIYQLGSGSEYFLMENRHKSSFDIFLNDEGLAVYHINESITSNTNEWDPAIRMLVPNNTYPLFTSTEALFTGGDILPSTKRTPLNPEEAYYNDTNLGNGIPTGIRIENIDTSSDYPNIHAKVFQPGMKNEYVDMKENNTLAIAESDLDHNGMINEADHSMLLKESLNSTTTASVLKSIYLAMKDAINDPKHPFMTSENPLSLQTLTASGTSFTTLYINAETNYTSFLKIHVTTATDPKSTVVYEDNQYKRMHTLRLDHLEPNTSYTIQAIARTPWEESISKTITTRTLPLPLIEDSLRSIYFDIIPSVSTTKNAQISTCLSLLDQVPQALLQSTDHTYSPIAYNFTRTRIRLGDTSLLPHVKDEVLILPEDSIIQGDGCQKYMPYNSRKALYDFFTTHHNSYKNIPVPLQELLSNLTLLDQLGYGQQKPHDADYKGTVYPSRTHAYIDLYEKVLLDPYAHSTVDVLTALILKHFVTQLDNTSIIVNVVQPFMNDQSGFPDTASSMSEEYIRMFLSHTSRTIQKNLAAELVSLGYPEYLELAASIDRELNPYFIIEPTDSVFTQTGKFTQGQITLSLYPSQATQLSTPRLLTESLNKFYDAFAELSGGTYPFGGVPIEFISKCEFEKQIDPSTLAHCPQGYMNYYGWGLAGNPIQILDSGMDTSINQIMQNLTPFGLIHELSHDFDMISSRPQYIFNSTTAEAWANIKLAYAIDMIGSEKVGLLDNKTFATTKDALNFTAPYYKSYKDRQLTFADLENPSPIVGNLTDMYVGIIADKITRFGSVNSIRQLLTFYTIHGNDIRAIDYSDKIGRMNQFVYFLSIACGTNLSQAFQEDNFPVSTHTENKIDEVLSHELDPDYLSIVLSNS